MTASKEQLDRIFQRTSGFCHICHKKMARVNYARLGARGAWEIEHSIPRAKGGTDHMNNLFAAHILCNRNKGILTSRTVRKWNGKTRSPLPPALRQKAKMENGFLGAACGGLAGLAVAGPIGAVVGAIAGGHLGASQNPDG